MLNVKGPILIGANHPNSFLDAILLSALFKYPVHSLARGDAFATKFITRILTSMNMLPVYRVSEGVENLESNYTTFDKCQQLFKENKIVLIFSEGRCINEWHLRPLKKGTARLAMAAWQLNSSLKVLPLGFNYSSFRSIGKEVHLNFGEFIDLNDMYEDLSSGKAIIEFNDILKEQLKSLVYEIPKDDQQKLRGYFSEPSLLRRILLAIPAVIGFILNAPLYFLFHLIIKDRSVDHYDSVMAGLMFLLYPVYVIVVTGVAILITGNWWYLLLLVIMPLMGICYIRFKKN
jgi:1-acyl-sn-glycerol-3-phosphate acyltransferase